jgi:hypothetical protein
MNTRVKKQTRTTHATKQKKLHSHEGVFTLDKSISNVVAHLLTATANIDSTKINWTARSGSRVEFLGYDDDHEDEEDTVMAIHGGIPMGSREFFIFKVQTYITQAMKTALQTKSTNIQVEEWMEDPYYYRTVVRQQFDLAPPARNSEYAKRQVCEIDYRHPTEEQFLSVFGSISPVRKKKYIVFLMHNSVRFYYRSNLKVGILINVAFVYNIDAEKQKYGLC